MDLFRKLFNPGAAEAPTEGGELPVTGNRGPYNHRGMFGIRGTARDVLGAIGDAFLTQAGRDNVYRPRREQEREADAMRGFQDDPIGAISRLTEGGFTRQAREMHQQGIENNVRNEQLGFQRDNNTRQQTEFTNDQSNDVHDRAVRMLTGANAQSYPAMRDQVRRYFTARGVTPLFELPEEYDERRIQSLRSSAVPVVDQDRNESQALYRQMQLDLAEDRIDNTRSYQQQSIRERQADRRDRSQRSRAQLNRPRPVDRYTGSDGRRRIVWSDGRETVSEAQVRPTGRQRPTRNIPRNPDGSISLN